MCIYITPSWLIILVINLLFSFFSLIHIYTRTRAAKKKLFFLHSKLTFSWLAPNPREIPTKTQHPAQLSRRLSFFSTFIYRITGQNSMRLIFHYFATGVHNHTQATIRLVRKRRTLFDGKKSVFRTKLIERIFDKFDFVRNLLFSIFSILWSRWCISKGFFLYIHAY